VAAEDMVIIMEVEDQVEEVKEVQAMEHLVQMVSVEEAVEVITHQIIMVVTADQELLF
jgi:hypothetical protein